MIYLAMLSLRPISSFYMKLDVQSKSHRHIPHRRRPAGRHARLATLRSQYQRVLKATSFFDRGFSYIALISKFTRGTRLSAVSTAQLCLSTHCGDSLRIPLKKPPFRPNAKEKSLLSDFHDAYVQSPRYLRRVSSVRVASRLLVS